MRVGIGVCRKRGRAGVATVASGRAQGMRDSSYLRLFWNTHPRYALATCKVEVDIEKGITVARQKILSAILRRV
jgi:hypothetical protein